MSWDIFSKLKIQYFLQKLKDKFVQKETGKGLSTNDYTTADKAKVDKIDETTTSISGNPISISGLKSNQLAKDPIITLEPIQAGSGTPSPDNIRAISGYDKIEVLSCGKNLFDISKVLVGTVSNGAWSWGGSTSKLFDLKFKENTQYTFSGYETQSGDNKNVRPRIVYTDGTVENMFLIANTTRTAFSKTSAENKTIDYIQAYWGSDSSAKVTIENFQIEESTSATTYVPYNKTTDLSLALGQTVYGGSLDVRTGKFTVKYGIVDLGDLSWQSRHTAYANVFSTESLTDYKIANDANAVCSGFNYDGIVTGIASFALKGDGTICLYYSTSSSRRVLYVKDSRYSTDANAFTTAVTGIKFVYELATPFTIQLTPHEISLLKDYAYVSTNGTSISLDYHNGELASLADVNQLGETVENLQTKLNYHDYTVTGDGTTTWGDLLASLRPIYESLSEDEKAFSKLIFRPESTSGNECLSYCGAYWYSRMGLHSNGKLWIDHASLTSGDTYYYQKNGDTFIDKTSDTTSYSLSLRVFVEVGNNS